MLIVKDLIKGGLRIKKSVVTIGVFDAIHMGHRALIKKVLSLGPRKGFLSVLITFDPYPAEILFKRPKRDRIMSYNEKIKILGGTGIDVIAFVNFNRKVANMSPQRFIEDILVKKIGTKHLVVGEDFSLGKNREGTIASLKKFGRKSGFRLHVVKDVRFLGQSVKSSKIRSLIKSGDVSDVPELLGRYYSLEGIVIKGKGYGSKLGYPTANMSPTTKILPRNGIYATISGINGDSFKSITYIGQRPTFENLGFSIETHIFGLTKKITGEHLTLDFVARIRDDKKFNDVKSLISQISRDIIEAKKLLSQK